jgi:hypothetical protein
MPPAIASLALVLRRRLGAGTCSGSAGTATGSGAAAAAGSSRAASISRALVLSTRVPYFAHSGEAFAGPSTSGAGPIEADGAASFVSTTGVGTPSSSSTVTTASPMPSLGRSSSRS